MTDEQARLRRFHNSKHVPVVDQDGFDKIECHQCGDCCEGMKLQADPKETLQFFLDNPDKHFIGSTNEESVREERFVLDMLIPTGIVNGNQYYACRHFQRDDADHGTCTVYDQRPMMCSAFPYNEPQAFERCSWNVRKMKKVLPMVIS